MHRREVIEAIRNSRFGSLEEAQQFGGGISIPGVTASVRQDNDLGQYIFTLSGPGTSTETVQTPIAKDGKPGPVSQPGGTAPMSGAYTGAGVDLSGEGGAAGPGGEVVAQGPDGNQVPTGAQGSGMATGGTATGGAGGDEVNGEETVDQLKERLANETDRATLESELQKEKDGKNRQTAIDFIQSKLDALPG